MSQTDDHLAHTIARIKRKLVERGLRLLPSLTQKEVEDFEARHRMRLPEAYRRFLLEISAGGDGPPGYGLIALSETVINGNGKALRPDRPFPLTKYWVWEDDADVDEQLLGAVFYDGQLYLGTDGCGMDWILIVSGKERGKIWQTTDVGTQPCAPMRDFLSWYEYWLDGGDDWFAACDE